VNKSTVMVRFTGKLEMLIYFGNIAVIEKPHSNDSSMGAEYYSLPTNHH
jgi:hypothetical protein